MTSLLVRLRLVGLLTALLVAVPAAALAADPPGDRAHEEQVKAEGDFLMQQLRYGEALGAYDRAFALYPDPRLYYNRSTAYSALGRYPEALEQLEAFREHAPEALKQKVPNLDGLIDSIRVKVATLEVATRVRGARVLVRGQVVGVTPLERPAEVNAGSAEVEVSAEGYEPFSQAVELPGGETVRLELNLVPRAGSTVLLVRSPVVGARIAIDRRDVGSAPAEQVVPPGAHRIDVAHPDYEPATVSTVLAPGEKKTVNVALEGKKPITAQWWFWTGIGVVVAGTVTAIIVHNIERPADSGDIPPGQISAAFVRF